MKKSVGPGLRLFALSAPYTLKTRVNETISMRFLTLSTSLNRW